MQTVAPGKTTPKVKTPSGVRRHSVLSTGNMALTADECTTLGGQSVGESACISGKACETTTESGEWKRVCLSKKE